LLAAKLIPFDPTMPTKEVDDMQHPYCQDRIQNFGEKRFMIVDNLRWRQLNQWIQLVSDDALVLTTRELYVTLFAEKNKAWTWPEQHVP